jgi:hypothetical protein
MTLSVHHITLEFIRQFHEMEGRRPNRQPRLEVVARRAERDAQLMEMLWGGRP